MEPQRNGEGGPTAIRLTFAVDGDGLELRRARRLPMRAPGGEPGETDDWEDRIGSWVEVRGRDEEVLYRRRMQRPVPEDVEVSNGGEKGSFRRVVRESPSGLVHVVVPDVAGARSVVLCERRPGRENAERPDVVEHATVPLAKLDLDGDGHGREDDHDGDGHGREDDHDGDGSHAAEER